MSRQAVEELSATRLERVAEEHGVLQRATIDSGEVGVRCTSTVAGGRAAASTLLKDPQRGLRTLNKRVLESLVKAGALDRMTGKAQLQYH